MARDDDDDSVNDAWTRARIVEGAALATLRGEATGPPEGDDDLRALVDKMVARCQRATEAERAPVILDDGSALALHKAARVLAEKEARRAFAPLSRTLRARDGAARALERDAAFSSPPSTEYDEEAALVDDDVRVLLEPAREAIAQDGGVSPRGDAAHIARALSLPDPLAFDDARAKALLRATREALAPALVRPLHAVVVPRFLTPCVFVHDDAVRLGHRETERAHAFSALLDDGARALTASTRARGMGDAQRALALALSFALSSEPVRRRVLDEERDAARRAARIVAATVILDLHIARTIARATAEHDGSVEASCEAVAESLGARVDERVLAHVGPALDTRPLSPGARARDRARDVARGASLALALRDAHDETWPLRGSIVEIARAAQEIDDDRAVFVAPRKGALLDLLGPLL